MKERKRRVFITLLPAGKFFLTVCVQTAAVETGAAGQAEQTSGTQRACAGR